MLKKKLRSIFCPSTIYFIAIFTLYIMIVRIAYCLIQLYKYFTTNYSPKPENTCDGLSGIIETTTPSESFSFSSE